MNEEDASQFLTLNPRLKKSPLYVHMILSFILFLKLKCIEGLFSLNPHYYNFISFHKLYYKKVLKINKKYHTPKLTRLQVYLIYLYKLELADANYYNFNLPSDDKVAINIFWIQINIVHLGVTIKILQPSATAILYWDFLFGCLTQSQFVSSQFPAIDSLSFLPNFLQ